MLCSLDLWGFLPFWGIHKVKTTFIITLLCLSHYINRCSDGVKAMLGKAVSILSAVATHCVAVILHHHIVTVVKNVISLDAAASMTNFSKSWAWSTQLFNILWKEMEAPTKHFCCASRYVAVSGRACPTWVVHWNSLLFPPSGMPLLCDEWLTQNLVTQT